MSDNEPRRRPPRERSTLYLILSFSIVLTLSLFLGPMFNTFRFFSTSSAASAIQRLTRPWSRSVAPLRAPAYSRIRVKTPEDIEKLYPLILDYTQHPEQAASVKELVFRCGILQPWYLCHGPSHEPWEARESARVLSGETEMGAAIQHLGLGEDKELEWKRELTWMKPQYVAERKAYLKGVEYSYDVDLYFLHKNTVFANHAAALLLTLCPNIERLTYEDNDSENPVLDILQMNNYDLLPQLHLQKLANVTLLPSSQPIISDPRNYVEMDILRLLRMFHRLPSIQSISADAIQTEHGEEVFPPGTANFTKFSATHSIFPSSHMAAFIRAPKRLEELTLTTGGRDTIDGGHYIVFPKTIGKVLECHKDSLRRLDLDLDEDLGSIPASFGDEDRFEDGLELDGYMYGFWEKDKTEMQAPLDPFDLPITRAYGETIGSFRDFNALTHLSIGIKMLLGPHPEVNEAPFRLIDALPISLEYLVIRGYEKGEHEHYDDQIRELIALREERLPNLRVLEGVEECVLSAKTVRDPEETSGLLYEIPEVEDGCLEVE